MSTHKHASDTIPIVDAVETLSNLADLDPANEVIVSEKHMLKFHNQKLMYRTIHWIQERDEDRVVGVIREVFRSVLNYVRKFYQNQLRGQSTQQKTEDQVKDIIVLVGEAAQRLDELVDFYGIENFSSFKEIKEYRELQNFYQRKIAKRSSEQPLVHLLSFAKDALIQQMHHRELREMKIKQKDINRIYIDFEAVKKDTEYELLMMRKQNGERFYSKKLLRNLKLVCEFGSYIGMEKAQDPLIQLPFWTDRVAQASAKALLKEIQRPLDEFYRIALRFKDLPSVAMMNHALMALMLSANPHNLLRNHPIKSCINYFNDFQHYFRACLLSADYQKILTYIKSRRKDQVQKMQVCLVNVVQAIAKGIYRGLVGNWDLVPVFHRLIEMHGGEIEEGIQADHLSDQLEMDYATLGRIFKLHPNGALKKTLKSLEYKEEVFDTLVQDNLPTKLYQFVNQRLDTTFVRMGAPIQQKSIHQAQLNPEFLSLLRSYQAGKIQKRHLMINLQDRTSWLERARCQLLEEFAEKEEFKENLSVITLATETDFCYQDEEYLTDTHAQSFIKHLKEHLSDPQSGCYFSEDLRHVLLHDFLDETIAKVHRIFYGGRNVLSKNERTTFIRLVKQLMVLRAIEHLTPNSCSFSCKDGIDKGAAWNAQFYVLMKAMMGEEIEPADYDLLHLMLFLPAMTLRERALHPEMFLQVLKFTKMMEEAEAETGDLQKAIYKAFGKLFDSTTFDSHFLHI